MRPNGQHLPTPRFDVVERKSNKEKLLQLYEAALSGSVPTLSTLIRNDPLILHRVSLSSQPETPLHISALAGHLDFTKALLTTKPELACRLDSFKCSPLHLASAEGHTEIVKALLEVNINVCLVRDAEGRIPLHLAAMRGNVEIIQELFDAEPNSIHQNVKGNSVIHLCIQYNQLEALRRLVAVVNENQLLDFRDHGGNTILHLAVMLRQSETVRYLVSIPKIKTEVNALNRIGISALDVLQHSAIDFKSLEIRDILLRAVAVSEHAFPTQQESLLPIAVVGENNTKTNSVSSSKSQSQALAIVNEETESQVDHERSPGTVRLRFTKLKHIIKSGYHKFDKFFKERDDWVEKRHKTLMLVATLTATMSFQVAINPPGGVWQQDYDAKSVQACGADNNNNFDSICRAGHAVMAYVFPDLYIILIIQATISFIASVSVVLLAISGLPLKNKFCTWLLTIAVVLSIQFTVFTYLNAMWLVIPDHIVDQVRTIFNITSFVWTGLVGLIVISAIIRLLLWLSIGLFSFTRKMLRGLSTTINNSISI